MKKNRRGASEIIYLVVIFILATITINSLFNYYKNINFINNKRVNITLENISRDNLSQTIIDKIKSNDINNEIIKDDYKITIKNITNKSSNTNITDVVKDYSSSKIYKFNKETNIIKEPSKNYFLLTLSKDPIDVGYNKNEKIYNLANINDNFYYGLETENNIDKNVLYLNTKSNDDKIIFAYEFDKNIKNYDFFVAKIEKNSEVTYNLYIKYDNTLKEIFRLN